MPPDPYPHGSPFPSLPEKGAASYLMNTVFSYRVSGFAYSWSTLKPEGEACEPATVDVHEDGNSGEIFMQGGNRAHEVFIRLRVWLSRVVRGIWFYFLHLWLTHFNINVSAVI